MDSGHRHGGGVAGKWKKRPTIFTNYRAPLLLFTFTVIAIFISSKIFISPSLLPLSPDSRPPQCTHTPGEKYLWYAPHSGFSNQLSEFRNAILMAAILNRTLIVPPVLDHHAVALGSCPKFRVLDPNELRFRVWNHSIQLIRDRRVFVSKWCDVNLSLACTADSSMHSSLLEKLRQCGSLLSGYDGNVDACLFASQEDCRTTVWTYQTDDGVLDSFQADEELKKKRKFSFSRTRKDVSRALGPGSTAGSATVLAFGSLFTGPYKGSESHIDIHEAPNDQRVQLVIQKIEFLQFVPEILNAGKSFAHEMISAPFICAQLRLLDGQFKNHWDGTFQVLKQTLDSLKQKGSLPIHVFIMTDLPRLNWTGSYLGDLEKDSDSFKLFVLREEDELVTETAKKLVNAAYGLKLQSVSSSFDGREQHCSPLSLPDILLYVEETICGCASLGFVGTAGSTIANSIELMRKNHACS
ncbi:O-fucosyltransferase 30-like isoform X2 [Salvia splendens]|uniref:O-fucosyltransferase 30-like isoform X2 n=1 Tax=Salvia splendens TaxID=180675 RepID=UPI001C263963|nr:O-fucosyltransferase 30-like isoform X2 [Salvia splendens]